MNNIIGQEIPEFTLQAYHAGNFREISKKDALGKWSIFFFYPADFTFVCPTELDDVQDHYEEIQKLGAEVFSASTDSHFAHMAWADTSPTIKRLQFPMLGDPAGRLASFFGLLQEKEWQALRGTFIADPEGIIRAYEVHDMGIGRDAQELVRKLTAAQFVREHGDQVCPAKWKPGAKTLTPGKDLVGKI